MHESRLAGLVTVAVIASIGSQAWAVDFPRKEDEPPRVFEAPLGLSWDQSPTDAKKALTGRYIPERTEKLGNYTHAFYRGTFAGFADADVCASFHLGKLVELTVKLPKQDNKTVTESWSDLIRGTVAKRGNPTQTDPLTLRVIERQLPPAVYYEQDKLIRRGRWAPNAVWRTTYGMIEAFVATADRTAPVMTWRARGPGFARAKANEASQNVSDL